MNILKRFMGMGCEINVVAVQSKKIKFSPSSFENFFRSSVDWMVRCNCPPRSLSVLGKKEFKEAQYYDFLNAEKRLRRNGFHDIDTISLSSFPPARGMFPTACQVGAVMTGAEIEGGISYFLWYWEGSLGELSSETIMERYDDLGKIEFIDYAFAFKENSKAHPEVDGSLGPFEQRVYKRGVISTKVYGNTTKKIIDSGLHPLDFIRDVYTFQILNPIHLSYKVGSQSLRVWINSSEANGRLVFIDGVRWLWVIPEKDMESVREILIKNNLLTMYLKDIDRVLEIYGKIS